MQSVELLGGRRSKEGYVKVHLSGSTSGTICPENWGLPEAMVVCRELGLKYADRATTVSSDTTGNILAIKDNVLLDVTCI